MSLYVVPNGATAERLGAVAAEFEYPGKSVAMKPGAMAWLWVDDDPARFAPALDPATGVEVIASGRLAWSAEAWARAESLPYEGGLASRLILERYLSGGAAAVVPYNGAAALVVCDPRNGSTHAWTDQFGYHPLFVYAGEDAQKCIFTTFPDVLLVDREVILTDDRVSEVEFVRAWRATPPNSYFTEVKHAGAATHTIVNPSRGDILREIYWEPFKDGFYRDIEVAAEALADAVRAAIHERTAIAERPLFFISGGADSRVLLFAAADRSKVVAVNLYERAAAETSVARELCAAAGCKFVALQRDNDFYPRNLMDSVRWSGAMWSVEDAHYPGFADRIADFNPDLVMTACTTDWLFKGYGLEKRWLSFFGRDLPFFRYTDERVDGFLPNVPTAAPTEYAAAVGARMEEWFSGVPKTAVTPLDRLRIEDRRVRPTAYTVSVSGQIMYRVFPYDTFLADSRVAECYSRIHPDWKLNREVWGKAATRICKGASRIVDSNYGWRLDASVTERAIVFALGWIGRRLRPPKADLTRDDDRPPSSGSWPELGWYVRHSPTVRRLWASMTPAETARLIQVTGSDPQARSLNDWAKDGLGMFSRLTLFAHWRENARRREPKGNPPPGETGK
jgi:hypothetical protein